MLDVGVRSLKVQGTGCWVQKLGLRGQEVGVRFTLWSMDQCLGFESLGFRVWVSGSGNEGLRLRVEG